MVHSKMGFAIIGTSLIARLHAQAILSLVDAKLIAVCSRDTWRGKRFATEFGCASYTVLEDMLTNPKVEILVIATPSGMHLEAAILAAKAGKHVLCEKPLDITLERVDAMIEAHRVSGTHLGCTFQNRYIPALQPIRDALTQGRFGTLTYAGVFVPWWRSNEYYNDSSWHGTKTLDGGGALMNQSIHMLDLLCDLMPPVESVAGFISSIGHDGLEVEDSATVALRYRGGALGIVYGSTSAWPGKAKRLEISGTKGSVILEDTRLTVFEFCERRPEDDLALNANSTISALGSNDPTLASYALHAACFSDFMNSIRLARPFQIDGASARQSIRLVQAIYQSAMQGCHIKL